MQTTEKLSLLKAMGIEVWRDRYAEAVSALSFHFVVLEASRPMLILADLDPSNELEEQNLVQAIAKALGFEVKASQGFSDNLESILSLGEEIIVMGNKISEKIRRKIIHTHAPSELLKNPKLKAETWQAIRHLKVA